MPSSLLQRIICKQNSNLSLLENSGCLQFTWANKLVHGLGKWSVKFKTGKFHLRIAFTNYYIYTNQFHFKTEKPLQKPETSIKDGLKKGNLNFHLEHSIWKNRTTLILDVLLLPKNFPLELEKGRYHLLSNQIFWKLWEVRILCFVLMLLFNSLGTLCFGWVKWKIINQSINK